MLFNLLLKAIALSLVVTISSIPSVFASSNYGAMKTTHIMDTVADPTHGTRLAIHKFELHVVGKSLNEIFISFPNGISEIQDIEIRDDSENIIKTNVDWKEKGVNITFDKPISSGTILTVRLQGVRINSPSAIFLYHLSGKITGITDFIPLGTVRIQAQGKRI